MLTTFSLGHRWVKLPPSSSVPPTTASPAGRPPDLLHRLGQCFSRWDQGFWESQQRGPRGVGRQNGPVPGALSGVVTAWQRQAGVGDQTTLGVRAGGPKAPTAFHLLGSYSGSFAVPPAKPPLFSILASVYLFEPSALAPVTSCHRATIPCVRAAPRAHGAPSPAGPGARVREREALWPPSQATAPLHAASRLPRSLEGAPPKPRDWGWSGARGGASPKPVPPREGGGRKRRRRWQKGGAEHKPCKVFFFLLHLIKKTFCFLPKPEGSSPERARVRGLAEAAGRPPCDQAVR